MSVRTSGASTTTSPGGEFPTTSTVASVGTSEHQLLGLGRSSVGGIAEVQRGDGPVGNDVVRDAALEPRDGDDLVERQPADRCLPALVGRHPSESLDGTVDSVVGEPRARCVTADAMERHTRGERSHAAGLHGEVGRLEQDREVGLVDERARVEERGKRIEGRRELLAPEQEEGDIDGAGIERREIAHELDRDRDAALHVTRPAPVHSVVGDRARDVVLCGNGVVVAGEDEQGRAFAAAARPQERLVPLEHRVERRGDQAAKPLTDLGLVEALRSDVHELERPAAQAICELAHRGERTAREGGAYFPP